MTSSLILFLFFSWGFQDRRAASQGDYDEQDRRVKGAEVFVGGLPRSATEGTLREIFSTCGEIVDLRIMKDQNGVSKLQGKRLAVDLSLDQDTLFFGNLCKEWSAEEFEELIHKKDHWDIQLVIQFFDLQTFKDVISVDLATASNLDSSTSKRRLNRGFAFVRFSSHGFVNRADPRLWWQPGKRQTGVECLWTGAMRAVSIRCDMFVEQTASEEKLGLCTRKRSSGLSDSWKSCNNKDRATSSLEAALVSRFMRSSSSFDSFPPKTIDHTSQAAARVLRIGSRTDFMLGGILHPAINWAERESNVDADEMAKIKTAFVGNLPANANEEYLKKLFGHFGEVIRVAVSRKGQYPVGFIHFGSRSELDNAIKEMDGKTVSVARPAVENDNKRSREEVKTRRSNVSGGKPDYSHGRYGHDSIERQTKAPRLSNRVSDVTDPYEAAVNSLPSAVNELLLRILRLGIGSPYDIDIHCIKSLSELPESGAVAVLNQRKVEAFGAAQILQDTTYLSRNSEIQTKRYRHQDYDYTASGSSRYSSLGGYPSSSYVDDPIVSQSRRYAEERPAVMRFDPYTGEPYKFDPFTGEPIRPEASLRRSGSLY
ncbi:Heterogeneous nuclear ribonucleoprotein A1 [Triticum urartu]|uniref:Heterogeneous nuclear ribonucleoprotein A1 n=1 Tax=Triticum urartu TaxID=4572 RepID=M7Z158_TRIUA|nr:Heterogeneous nuclear ribonucleoprotein A1 [Triticum urartu]